MGAALHFNNFLLIMSAFWRIFGESAGWLLSLIPFQSRMICNQYNVRLQANQYCDLILLIRRIQLFIEMNSVVYYSTPPGSYT